MKRTLAIIIGAAITGFGAAGFAGGISGSTEVFGNNADRIDLEDVRLDAQDAFARVDVNGDGFVTADEYAGQAVVNASLARFNRAVVIAGKETYHINLPEGLGGPISAGERTSIDAVARANFRLMSGDDRIMDKSEWIAARLSEFASVDYNDNGALEGREVDVFALSVARYPLSAV